MEEKERRGKEKGVGKDVEKRKARKVKEIKKNIRKRDQSND